jgi:uncharacterized protein DUF6622
MAILDIISSTPIWVWVILGYLLVVGSMATRPMTVSLLKLGIMPSIFIWWSFYSLYLKCTVCWPLFILWVVVFTISMLIGQQITRSTNFTFDTNTRLFHIPGSWFPLLLSCSFFAVKYAMGATYALMPEMRTNLALMSFDVAVSALIAGLAWGRFTVYLLAYQHDTCKRY